jgi:hypothetical protein
MREMAAAPGETVVGVGHGDLIPHYLLRAELLRGVPAFRTGSLFRVRLGEGRPVEVAYVDRDDLKVSANGRAGWDAGGEQPSRRGGL